MFCCHCQSADHSSWLCAFIEGNMYCYDQWEKSCKDKKLSSLWEVSLIWFLNLRTNGKKLKRHWCELSEAQLTFAERHFMWLIGNRGNGYEPCRVSASCIQCTLAHQINWCCIRQNDDAASAPVLLQSQELRSHLVTHVIPTTLIMHEKTQSAVFCCAAELHRNLAILLEAFLKCKKKPQLFH